VCLARGERPAYSDQVEGETSWGLGSLGLASISDEALRAPLLEREHVWERATRRLEAARSGRGSVLLLEGPAGLGKSALLRAIGSHAADTGMDVLAAAGRPGEESFGFGVVVQLFESRLDAADDDEREAFLSDAAHEAVPIFTPGNREVEPTFDVLHGLYRLCTRLASSSELAILVDDVDLVDAESLRFLTYLAERIGEHPVALVLATGPVGSRHAPELVDEIAQHPATVRFELSPLTAHGTGERVRSKLPDASDDGCRRLHEASAGYPFIIDALTAEAAGTGGPAAPAISAWALRRAARLHAAAPQLLRALAILGSGSEPRHAAGLASVDLETATPALDLLVEGGLLKPEERLSFQQPAVAEAIEASLALGERAAAHLAAAELLSRDEGDPEAVATHLLNAPHAHSAWVVDALCAAAAIAFGRGAPNDAVAYLRRALEEPPERAQRAHVVLELGRAEAMAGDPQAASRLTEASSSAEAQEQPEAVLATGRALFALGRAEEAMAVFELVLGATGASDPELSERLRAEHAVAQWMAGLPDGARVGPAAPRGEALTPAERVLLAVHAMDAAIRGIPCTEVRDLAERALGRGALLDDETADGLTYYAAAGALLLTGNLQTAEAALTAAIAEAETRGSVLGFATASRFRALAILMRGRVGDAAAEARKALAVERDGSPLGYGGARLVLVHCLAETGDLEAAKLQLERAEAVIPKGHPFRRASLLLARGRVRMQGGDTGGALEDFLACGALMDKMGARNPAAAPWRSNAGRAYAAMGELAKAERLMETELALAQEFGAPGPIGRSLRALASIREPQQALELLEAAVDTLQESQTALERAKALVDYGAALRRSGRRREAREPLRSGREISEACGAELLTRRAMRELTSAGARPRRAALSGMEALTERERQVAALAATGLSNREIAAELFVQPKTVEFHLGNSYQKLGVSSRLGLAEFFGTPER
jgi:DNA-binding CsgD family transcriptional regulator